MSNMSEQVMHWSAAKLAKELAFAEACKDDGPAEAAWYRVLAAEQARRETTRG